jgi:hypothetical protein
MKDLFGDMPTTLSISVKTSATALTKDQKMFNTLIKQIEMRRNTLSAWETAIPIYQQKFSTVYNSLQDEFAQRQFAMVQQLDTAINHTKLTKTEQQTVHEMICHLAEPLLALDPDADWHTELKVIYNQHNIGDYDSELADEARMLQDMMENELGINLGDDFDFATASPDDMLRRIHEHMSAMQEQEQSSTKTRKKSAKQQAKEEKLAAEAKEVSLSIREVFRKLASALHPDREPDPAERARKTVLMQRANSAYESRNLLQLLELQLELEHIDQAALLNLNDARLKHYNKILREQVNELNMEIDNTELQFRFRFNVSTPMLEPATLIQHLNLDIANMQQSLAELNADFQVFDDKKQLKSWLKDMRDMLRQHNEQMWSLRDMPF